MASRSTSPSSSAPARSMTCGRHYFTLSPGGGFANKLSFRGAAEGCEPGTHEHRALEYGFGVHRSAAPRNDNIFLCKAPGGGEDEVEEAAAPRRRARLPCLPPLPK